MKIRDRVKDLRRVPASALAPNPRNWRTHPTAQRDAMRGVLAEVGFADAILVREMDDGTLQVIDGHLRAEEMGDAEVPVLVLDVTDAEADYLLATHDPLTSLAESDPALLTELLRGIETANDAVRTMLDDVQTVYGAEIFEGDMTSLFSPVDTGDDTGDDDATATEETVTCPHCGETFTP